MLSNTDNWSKMSETRLGRHERDVRRVERLSDVSKRTGGRKTSQEVVDDQVVAVQQDHRLFTWKVNDRIAFIELALTSGRNV